MSENRSFHEQGFLLFYGLVMGLLVGVWGNLWADSLFEYIVKGDKSDVMAIAVIVTTSILIAMIVMLLVFSYSAYKKWRKKPEKQTSYFQLEDSEEKSNNDAITRKIPCPNCDSEVELRKGIIVGEEFGDCKKCKHVIEINSKGEMTHSDPRKSPYINYLLKKIEDYSEDKSTP
jgi:cbb3-type cytochrome oxidase subunit 3